MSVSGYQLDPQLNGSRNNIPFNANPTNEIFNFNREVSKLLEPAVRNFRYCMIFEVFGTIPVFFLAFCNVRSTYNMADSIVLTILGITMLFLCYYTYKLFNNADAVVSKKKCYLIYITCIGFSIAAASASYLVSAKLAEWCGYIVTFNGPLSEEQIVKRLNDVGFCKNASYNDIKAQVKNVINDKCGSSSYCKNQEFYLTKYKMVLGIALINILIYLIFQLFLSVYMYQKIHTCQSEIANKQAIQLSSQRQNLDQFGGYYNNPVIINNRNQHNPPQIYQAQLAPAFFGDQPHQQEVVVVGQPIPQDEQIVYYNDQNQANKARGYSVTKIENQNL